MSMIGYYVEISPKTLRELLKDPSLVESVVLEGEEDFELTEEDLDNSYLLILIDKLKKMVRDPSEVDVLVEEGKNQNFNLEIENHVNVSFRKLKEMVKDPSCLPPILQPKAKPEPDAQTEISKATKQSRKKPRKLTELDIEKAWEAIHFLLTGEKDPFDDPLSWVTWGRREIGDELVYGPASYLTAGEVKKVAALVEKIAPEEIGKRFTEGIEAFKKADIYAINGEEPEQDQEYIVYHYANLRDFYFTAARNNNAVLFYLG